MNILSARTPARFAGRDGAFYTWKLRNPNPIGLTD